jgi:hypothetical protein
MGMHRDREERVDAPVVSLSIGAACVFRFGNTDNRKAIRRSASGRPTRGSITRSGSPGSECRQLASRSAGPDVPPQSSGDGSAIDWLKAQR